jgi:hypothetical protein
MSMSYRPRQIVIDVDEFRGVFLSRGWRGIERNYGASSSVLMQMIALAGGPALLAERAALQPCGRKAGR